MLHLMSLSLLLSSLIHVISSQTILHHIASDTTLTVSNSPYIVNSYVTFHSTAHIIIENGVEIIFIHDYFISIFGSLNCGCNNTQILNNKTKGLSNTNSYIHMYGNESAPMSIGIFINQQSRIINPPKIEFCNTLFENIQNGIVTTSKQYAPYTIHNCEFKSVNNAIKHSTNVINFVYNSYFHEMNSIHSGGGVIYDHCLFRLFGKFSSDMEQAYNIAIRNSEIYGNENQICININSIAGDPYYGIYNNIINGCKDGIEIWNVVTIRNNTINNCSRYGIYIKNIDISWIYDVDVMYNIFNGNGQYDIYMDNVNSVNVEYNYINTIYGQNIDSLHVYMNMFMDVRNMNKKRNHMLTVGNCSVVDVLGNRFINNKYMLGVLYVYNNSKYINISSNIFMDNDMEYIMKMDEVMTCDINDNDIINNTIYEYMIDVNCDEVSLEYNVIQENVKWISSTNKNIEKRYDFFVCIQTANRVYITYNLFTDNMNNILDIEYNLLYLYQPEELHVLYNIFDTNYNMENILYINYSNYNDTIASINYNNFYQKENHINNYIQIYTSETIDFYNELLDINMNNFYNQSNINHFIATDNININANSNYYDGLKSYLQINSKFNDICDSNTIGFINITRVSEYPMHIKDIMDMVLVYHCSWNLYNCTTISNYKCDSDTYAPTISPSNIPTTRPTPPLIIAGTPTITPTKENKIDAITTSENNNNISTTAKIKAIIDIKASTMNHSILIIGASIGMAFICLISFEVLYCLRQKASKRQIANRHLSYSDQDELQQHSQDHKISDAFPPPPPRTPRQEASDCEISVSIENDTKEEEEQLVNDNDSHNHTEIEGNRQSIAPIENQHVKDDTMTASNGFGENDINEQELYGIQLAEDEFIVGSLPKKTDDGFGEGEYFVVRGSLDENNEMDSGATGPQTQ